MTGVVELDTRATIEAFVRADPALHIYELGDLDPFFCRRLGMVEIGDYDEYMLTSTDDPG